MKRKRKQDPPWTPFVEVPAGLSEKAVAALAERAGVQPEFVRHRLREIEKAPLMVNSRYSVIVMKLPAVEGPSGSGETWPAMFWLSIRRNDRSPIRNWRDLQRIKNEIVGPENEGVELYPAESRLADTSNQYHLFVLADARNRFPFGFVGRAVVDHDPDREAALGTRQEPIE